MTPATHGNTTIDDVKAWIDRYRDLHWPVVPIDPGTKRCTLDDWQKPERLFEPHEWDRRVPGLRLGSAPTTIADDDSDSDEAMIASRHLMPTTDAVFGRPGRPDAHRLYFVDSNADDDGQQHALKSAHVKFSRTGGGFELRWTGQQTVLPPSAHARGARAWLNPQLFQPSRIGPRALWEAWRRKAAAAILMQLAPPRGHGAHNFCICAAGLLAALGVAEEYASVILSVVSDFRNLNERDALAIVEDTYTKHASGLPVAGGPKLKDAVFEPALVDKIYDLFDETGRRRRFDDINARYAVAINKNDLAIISRQRDPHDGQLIVHSVDQFKRVTLNQTIAVEKADKNGKKTTGAAPIADQWLKDANTKYHDRVVSAPLVVTHDERGEPQFHETHDAGREYNTWAGYAVTPRAGDWSMFRAHLHDVWCHGNDGYFRWLTNWLAALAQRPGERGHSAVVVRGKEGTGKTVLFDYIGDCFGPAHYLRTSRFPERFNKQLYGKVLLNLNEAFWAGSKDAEARLKEYITDQTYETEGKFENLFTTRNALHVAISGNDEWVVPVSLNPRRSSCCARETRAGMTPRTSIRSCTKAPAADRRRCFTTCCGQKSTGTL